MMPADENTGEIPNSSIVSSPNENGSTARSENTFKRTLSTISERDSPKKLKIVDSFTIAEDINHGQRSDSVNQDIPVAEQFELFSNGTLNTTHRNSTLSIKDRTQATVGDPWTNQYEIFKSILPDAETAYLRKNAKELHGNEAAINDFIVNALERQDYPLKTSVFQPRFSDYGPSVVKDAPRNVPTLTLDSHDENLRSFGVTDVITIRDATQPVPVWTFSNNQRTDVAPITTPVTASSLFNAIPIASSSSNNVVLTSTCPSNAPPAAAASNASVSSSTATPATTSSIDQWTNQFEIFRQILPDADSLFLREKAQEFQGDEQRINQFIADALENKNYPIKRVPPIVIKVPSLTKDPFIKTEEKKKRRVEVSAAAGSSHQLLNESKIPIVARNMEIPAAAGSSQQLRKENENLVASEPANDLSHLPRLPEFVPKPKTNGKTPWADQLETFVTILPEADPSFLEEKAQELYNDGEKVSLFITNALEKKDYPSRKDWQWRQDQLALQKKYKEEFSVEQFLEIFPDPFSFFLDKTRKTSRTDLGMMFLRNKYTKLKLNDISREFLKYDCNLTLTCQNLDEWKGTVMKSRRTNKEYDITQKNGAKAVDLPFLQEIAFIENQQLLKNHLDGIKEKRAKAFQEAKDEGKLIECMCCYDDEVLIEESSCCTRGHIFCNNCVRNGAEVLIGDGKTSFPCLTTCDEEFELNVLQKVLKPVIFSKMMQRKQVEEVKAAGLDGLVQCPFCEFCNIPPPGDNVFRCLNPECMRESCRLCKEESHIPLRCNEVEKSEEVKMRTYIENKMTEALVRTCWKCQRKFVKESGCNKMTCQCGALMCYVCRQPVKDYTHFNGPGGDAIQKCPLYSDHHALEDQEVRDMAVRAKNDIQNQKPNVRLKHDPTANLPHYTPMGRVDYLDSDYSDSDLEDYELNDHGRRYDFGDGEDYISTDDEDYGFYHHNNLWMDNDNEELGMDLDLEEEEEGGGEDEDEPNDADNVRDDSMASENFHDEEALRVDSDTVDVDSDISEVDSRVSNSDLRDSESNRMDSESRDGSSDLGRVDSESDGDVRPDEGLRDELNCDSDESSFQEEYPRDDAESHDDVSSDGWMEDEDIEYYN